MEQTEHIVIEKPTRKLWKILKRIFIYLSILVLMLISGGALLGYFYSDDVKGLIIKELNKHLNSQIVIEPQNIDLTIVKSFPQCALEFKNVLAYESNDFKTHDTLLFAKRLALSFNIKDLFNKNCTINKIDLEESVVNLKVDKSGKPNYIIWKSENTSNSNDSLKFALEKISLTKVKLNYKNSKDKLKIASYLNEMVFSGKFNDADYVLKTNGLAFVDLFQVQKVKYLQNKKVKVDLELDVKGKRFTIVKADTKINSTLLNSNGSFVINDSLVSLDISFEGKNLDISSTLSLLPENFQSKINDYESEGTFYAQGECHYAVDKPFILNSKFGIKKANITYKSNGAQLSNVNLDGEININENRSYLNLNNVRANLKGNSFAGNVEVINFNDPLLKLNVEANTNLEELISFYPIDTLQSLSGNIKLKTNIEALVSDLKANVFSPNIVANGNASLLDVKAKFKGSEKEINIPSGEVKLSNRNLEVEHLNLVKGNSDITIIGEMPNFLGFMFDSKKHLIVNSTVSSNSIELEDFLFSGNNSSQNSSNTVNIPANLDLNIVLNVKKLSFQKFNASSISGTLLLKDKKIAVQNMSCLAMDGNISMNALADASGNDIKISGDCNFAKINIKTMFYQLNNFGQNTINDTHLKGFATANINFTGIWNKELTVDLNSINATSNILIEQGELIGFKPLESLAKYIDVSELKHIKFSSLQSAIEIKNKTITLPKTSIKSTAINMELWGKHTFDNQIDYHIQLLISELLAKKPRANKNFDEELSLVENDPENRRSVFILMTGPIDNPTIKYDRKGAKQKIKEDIQQEKQNLKQILKEEFGLFKKDSISAKNNTNKADQKFQIKVGEETKKDKPLQPKKKEDDEDF